MNKVLMSHSVIFKQQSANVVKRSQMTFSRLQCIMYDWTKKKISFGLAGQWHTHARKDTEKKAWIGRTICIKHIFYFFLYAIYFTFLHFFFTDGQSLGQTQIHVFKSCTTGCRHWFSIFPVLFMTYGPCQMKLVCMQTQSWEKCDYLPFPQQPQVSWRQAH